MTIYKYFCFVCGFIWQSVKKHEGVAFKCPWCGTVVETRVLPEEVQDVKQDTNAQSTIN